MQNSIVYPDHLSVLSRALLCFFSDNLSRNSCISISQNQLPIRNHNKATYMYGSAITVYMCFKLTGTNSGVKFSGQSENKIEENKPCQLLGSYKQKKSVDRLLQKCTPSFTGISVYENV